MNNNKSYFSNYNNYNNELISKYLSSESGYIYSPFSLFYTMLTVMYGSKNNSLYQIVTKLNMKNLMEYLKEMKILNNKFNNKNIKNKYNLLYKSKIPIN
jgi:hypothetical protein